MKTLHRQSLPPWASNATSHLMKKRQMWIRKYRGRASSSLSQKVKAIEEKIRYACKIDQAAYEGQLAENRNTKKLFKCFKSLRNGSAIPPKITWHRTSAATTFDQCCLFNGFFKFVFTEDARNDSQISDVPNKEVLIDYDTSEEAIESIVENIDVSKSRDPDRQPTCLFKYTPAQNNSLSHLFHIIKQTKQFPDNYLWRITGP